MSKVNWLIFLDVFCVRLTFKIKKVVLLFYISPSEISGGFNDFHCNFDKILNDAKQLGSYFFYYICWLWCYVIATDEGVQTESLMSTYGLCQLISDPTHFLPNLSSFIDVIFQILHNKTLVFYDQGFP